MSKIKLTDKQFSRLQNVMYSDGLPVKEIDYELKEMNLVNFDDLTYPTRYAREYWSKVEIIR